MLKILSIVVSEIFFTTLLRFYQHIVQICLPELNGDGVLVETVFGLDADEKGRTSTSGHDFARENLYTENHMF